MSKISGFLSSLIGLKVLMSVTGIILILFLITHVAANLLVLVNVNTFNFYSYQLTSNKVLLYAAEVFLAGVFILHVLAAIKLTRLNRQARPEKYIFRASTGRSRRSWMSRNMMLTGTVILLFLIFHIKNFKFGEVQMTVQNGVEMRNLAWNVITDFQQTSHVIIYVLAMLILILHLIHASQSFFASLGLENSRTAKFGLVFSRLLTIGIGGGFILIPLWIYFVGVN